jgi:hypothetical protein
MAKKKIRGNLGVLLTYLGRLYGTPANAIKEYISNALDEWIKAKTRGEMQGSCEVSYRLEKSRIVIDYNSPGMDAKEFEAALNRVADSMKRELTMPQIGELGIGIFAFNQVGATCTFYSKKTKGASTIKVVLTSNSDEYEIETAKKIESRPDPGMTIVITRLHQDPTKPRGSLAPQLLQRFFAEKFDSYLREGNLKVTVNCLDKVYQVQPSEIGLPPVGEAFVEVHLSADWQKKFCCQFWFDPSGKSRVSIRHTGVSIIEDLSSYPAYGLEESIYASGFLKGYIDADFLKPLPSRTSFEENQDWVQFLIELDKIRPSLEAEVEELRRAEEEKRLTEVQKKAIDIARDILEQEQFKDLELLPGFRKLRGPVVHPGVTREKGKSTAERSKKPGEPGHPGGFRISYKEERFEDGPSRHSEFVSGTVRVNELNPDFLRESRGSEQAKLAYATLMIGKEAIVYGDKSHSADYFLEKLLSYLFQVRNKTGEELVKARVKKMRDSKTRKTGIHKQTTLDL